MKYLRVNTLGKREMNGATRLVTGEDYRFFQDWIEGESIRIEKQLRETNNADDLLRLQGMARVLYDIVLFAPSVSEALEASRKLN